MEKEEKINPLVSIIIPFYNSEMTLERCIASVAGQNYFNTEIIFIDNGSQDNGKAIVEKYALADDRINLCECCHGTVSEARNIGITKAAGKYIYFVDSDDYIEKETVDRLVSEAEKKEKLLVICDYIQFNDAEKDIEHFHMGEGSYLKKDFIKKLLHAPGAHYYGVLWNKLYQTVIIKENKIRFQDDVSMGEDFIFNMEYLKYVENIKCLNDKLYHYWWKRAGSLSNVKKEEEEVIAERLRMYHAYEDFFKNEGKYKKYKNFIQYYIVKFYFDELAILGEDSDQYRKLLYKTCFSENNISKAKFGMFWFLKKAKKLINK